MPDTRSMRQFDRDALALQATFTASDKVVSASLVAGTDDVRITTFCAGRRGGGAGGFIGPTNLRTDRPLPTLPKMPRTSRRLEHGDQRRRELQVR